MREITQQFFVFLGFFRRFIRGGVWLFLAGPVFAQVTPTASVVPSPIAAMSQRNPTATMMALTEEALFQVQQDYTAAMTQKRFDQAATLLGRIPTKDLSASQREDKKTLRRFQDIEDQVANSSTLFQRDDELDDQTRRAVQRLYREAQAALLANQTDLARDICIHMLFLHRQNLRAKSMLETILGLKTGAYRVENMEEKYWKQSSVLFYGGNYGEAADILKALAFFDQNNPVVYERLGSCYYMLGENQSAISAWNTALFLKPENKELQILIAKVQKIMEEDRKKAKEQRQTVRQTRQVAPENLQLMGMFPNQERAYDFATKLRAQGNDPIVAEEEDGRWSVKIVRGQVK